LEGDFSVRATSDRLGHIRLDVKLRNHDPDDNWRISAPVFLDAGSLDTVAADAEAFFSDACDAANRWPLRVLPLR
jgi:hypothetical protein